MSKETGRKTRERRSSAATAKPAARRPAAGTGESKVTPAKRAVKGAATGSVAAPHRTSKISAAPTSKSAPVRAEAVAAPGAVRTSPARVGDAHVSRKEAIAPRERVGRPAATRLAGHKAVLSSKLESDGSRGAGKNAPVAVARKTQAASVSKLKHPQQPSLATASVKRVKNAVSVRQAANKQASMKNRRRVAATDSGTVAMSLPSEDHQQTDNG